MTSKKKILTNLPPSLVFHFPLYFLRATDFLLYRSIQKKKPSYKCCSFSRPKLNLTIDHFGDNCPTSIIQQQNRLLCAIEPPTEYISKQIEFHTTERHKVNCYCRLQIYHRGQKRRKIFGSCGTKLEFICFHSTLARLLIFVIKMLPHL